MTRFKRREHLRVSKLGNRHWVSSHEVERNDWDRGSYQKTYPHDYISRLQELRAARGATACYIKPNAKCPECGEPVFYYQNEFGSRVFFDELGPPWPKHPCTDQGPTPSHTGSGGSPRILPTLRDSTEGDTVAELLAVLNLDPLSNFRWRYGTDLWKPYLVQWRYSIRSGTLVVLQAADEDGDSPKFVAVSRLPRTVTRGTFVFVNRSRLACFNILKMEPQEFRLKTLRSASAFVKALVGDEPDSAPKD